MLKRCILGALAICLVMGSYALTKPAPVNRDGDAQRIADLIKQLASSKDAERTQAQKELEAIGAPALEALRKASKDGDAETTKRAGELIRKMEDRIVAANLLTPKRVHLKVKDMPALDAVAELSRLSGYPIQVAGDRNKVADTKITLDTGDVTFWEALDKLCAKAGLTEMNQFSNGPIGTPPGTGTDPNPPPVIIRPPFKVRPPIRIQPAPAPDAPPAEAPKEVPADPKPGAARVKARLLAVQAEEAARAQEQAAQDRKAAEEKRAVDEKRAAEEKKAAQEKAAQNEKAAQGQDTPVQVQRQPVQIQPLPVQIQPFPGPGGGPMPVPFPGRPGRPGFGGNGQIVLVPGTPKNDLVSYAGAVRVRVIPVPEGLQKQLEKAGQYIIMLDVAAEPKLQSFNITGAFTIEKAVDDQGQTLTVAANEPIPNRGGGRVKPGQPAPDGAPANGPGGAPDLPPARQALPDDAPNGALAQPGEAQAQPAQAQPAQVQPLPAIQPAFPPGGPVGDIATPFPGFGMGNRTVTIRLKAGEKEAKALKELAGTIAATVMAPPEALISLDNVLKGAGQTAKGKDGGSLKLDSIEKMGNGEYKVQIKMETPQGGIQGGFGGGGMIAPGVIDLPMEAPQLPPQAPLPRLKRGGALQFQGGAQGQAGQAQAVQAVQIQNQNGQVQVIQVQIDGNGGVVGGAGIAAPIGPGGPGGPGMPELVDAKGNKFQITQIPARRFNFNNGVATQEMTIVFRAANGAGEPDRLVVSGSRMVTLNIPFAFQNVPLR